MVYNILIHYAAEVTLKGANRLFFENKVIENIKKALKGENLSIKKINGRVLVEYSALKTADINEIEEKLKRVFGIANFSFVSIIKYTLPIDATVQKRIQEECFNLLKNKNFSSFAIRATRAEKRFPLTSPEIERVIGGYIKKRLNVKVDLKNPEIACFIEIIKNHIFIYDKKIKGAGGLPVGVSGKLVALISSGFDSPVASYLMMKRGAEVIFVHFHSYPQTSIASQENVKELVKVLNTYQFSSKIYFVNILEIQKQIMLKAPEKFRVVLYRRVMLKIANEIAKKEKALGIVTGDSLGQVASQTLENLKTISTASKLPIYRPLIGFDKEEIMDLSKKIGLYEISSQPYEDCCSLFVPRHPATKTMPEEIEKIEKGLKLEKLQKRAIEESSSLKF